MKVFEASGIRNVAVVGHGGCGKTSLVSAMLFDAGAEFRVYRLIDVVGDLPPNLQATDLDGLQFHQGRTFLYCGLSEVQEPS